MAANNHMNVRGMFNKVPEVTIFFWIIKVLCTTVGETASDFLNVNLNFGLVGTSIVMGVLLVVALAVQFWTKKYIPVIYWLNVVLISIFGTLVTDNLTDKLGFPLEYSTIFFSVLLLITFAVWYWQEKTLSIHSIFTTKREAFYWLAVLFTFALGTAAGDLYAEALGLGYATTGVIIAALVALMAVAWRLGLDAILAFWVIYIMTRPLGASLGDFLTQSKTHGGLGLGATATTVIFTLGIVATVLYLALTKRDITTAAEASDETETRNSRHVLAQVVVVALFFAVAAIGGYFFRQQQLRGDISSTTGAATTTASGISRLGDLSQFKTLAQQILDAVNKGDWASANARVNDLEYAWDSSEGPLKARNAAAWTHVDSALDKVFREVRAVHPNQQTAQAALQNLLVVLSNP
ncbi:MAG: hypothetical protein JO019_00380 [Candidatus Kaiserbacteria bacterium]|nr:hypothetical protein [Candidatus Kaiserbacteria bacterium]